MMNGTLYLAALLFACAMVSGCAVTAPLEPVHEPPARFRHDTIVPVHFVDQSATGIACAKRAGIGHIADQACASPDLMTVPNPCSVNGGWYAEVLCHELAHANSWPAGHPK